MSVTLLEADRHGGQGRGRTLFASAPPPITANEPSYAASTSHDSYPPIFGVDSLALGSNHNLYVQRNAIYRAKFNIKEGLRISAEVSRRNYHAFGVFFLRGDLHDSPVHDPTYNQDVRSMGWWQGAGAALTDTPFHGYAQVWQALTKLAYGTTPTLITQSAWQSYTSTTSAITCVWEVIPTATAGVYTLRYSTNGITRVSGNVQLTDEVWVGFGAGQHYSYPTEITFRKVQITAGTSPRLKARLGTRIDIASGLEEAVPSTIAPYTLMEVGTELNAVGSAVNELRPSGSAAPAIQLRLSGSYELENPEYNPADYEAIHPRLVQGVSLAIPTPAVAHGQPYVPEIWAKPDSSFTANRGAFQVIPDPPPPPLYSPPGAGTYRWVAGDAQVAENDWIENWPPVGGSGPAWKSLFPYRPRKRPYVHTGKNGRTHRYPSAVIHDPNYVEHLWIDLGKGMSQPFTWVFCTMITSWPMPAQWLLDTGGSLPRSTIAEVRRDRMFSENLGYRTIAVAEPGAFSVTTQDSINHIIARSGHHTVVRPRVFFAVFNGDQSYAGVWDNRYKSIVKGRAPARGLPRYFISGRRNATISDQQALKGITLEIRFFEGRALTPPEMEATYGQLATAYNFQIN